MTLDLERARQMAQRSAEVRRGLTPERIAEELPPLDTPQHIREAYQTIQRWGALGLIPGGVANALVRSADGALKLLEAQIDVGLIAKLEKRVRELESELAAARKVAR
jgi:tRNA nucleotidyltransferase/poly(A) polymerase